MAFTKILGPGIHTLANFHSHNINSSGIITATKFVGDMEPGGGTGSFDSLTVTGNLGVGGTVTYTDVTNVDAVGIITAQSGIYIGAGATVGSLNTTTGISSFKTLNVDETSTFNGSVGIADSIIHIGNTDTSIRFPADDIFAVETAGSEALRITSDGEVGINTTVVPYGNFAVDHGQYGLTRISEYSHLLLQNKNATTTEFWTLAPRDNGRFGIGRGIPASGGQISDEKFTILSNGLVGVATDNPKKTLNVFAGVGTTELIRLSQPVDSSVQQNFGIGWCSNNNHTWPGALITSQEYDVSDPRRHLLFYTRGLNSDTAPTERLRITYEGNVDLYGATAGVTSCYWDASANTLIFNDDVKSAFGNGSDLSIYHTGSLAIINNSTGDFDIQSDIIRLKRNDAGQTFASFINNGQAEFSYSGTTRLSTSPTGITVTGEVAASQDYPNFRPTVDWNFAAEKKLDPRITYTRTGPASYIDENGLVKLVGDNTPRFDHDPVTRECKGLLIEPSRTNIFASSDAGNSAWVVDNSMTKGANSTDTKDPAGTYTACKLMSVASAGSSSQIYDQTSQSSGGVVSAWAKKGTHNVLGIYDYSGGSGTIRAWFDLNTGEHRCEGGTKVAAGVQSSGNDSNTTNMIEYPNGWYRCIYYEAANMTYAFFRICDFDSDTEASASSNSIYLWGLQGEVNVTYATSHIPCNTGSMPGTITRGVDLCQITGEDFSDFYNQVEGTIVSEHSIATGVASGDNTYVYQVDDGSDTNVAFRLIDHNSAHGDLLRAYGFVGGNWGSPQYGFDSATPAHDTFHKVAVGVKKDDFGVNFFGETTSTDTSGDINVDMSRLTIGNHHGGTAPLQGHLRRFIYYTQKLTTNQLKTLSS